MTTLELRAIWERAPSPEVRELLWEIHRLHGVLVGCRGEMEIVRAAWREEVGGWLVGIETMRSRLLSEPCVAEAGYHYERNAIAQPEPGTARASAPAAGSEEE